MDTDRLISELKQMQPALASEGVIHLALFGSRARGDFSAASDIDLLVDVDAKSRFSVLNLVNVEHMVGDALGLPANVFMRRSLDQEFRRSISEEVIEVF
jgi:hypothetical protein